MGSTIASRKRYLLIILSSAIVMLLVTLVILFSPASPTKATSIDGFLDLSHTSVSEIPHKLTGEWEFFWDELLTPEDFQNHQATSKATPHMISIPGSWRGYQLDDTKLKSTGASTFRLVINISEKESHENLALRIPTVFHSYKLWLNGELIAEVGEVGLNKQETKPHLMSKFVSFKPESERLELVMQVANFDHKRGGITKAIEFGSSDTLQIKSNVKKAAEVFTTATLLVIGLYHMLLFYLRRKDRATLYFGLFTLFFGIRSLLVGEMMITQLLPRFSWALQFKIEYLVLCVCPYLLVMYFDSIFPNYISRWFYISTRVVTSLLCMLVILTPAIVYTQFLTIIGIVVVLHVFYLLIGLIDAIILKKQGSKILLGVSFVTFASVINDFLYYNGWTGIENAFPIGLLVFTIAQMFLLSSRFTKAVTNEERITKELIDTNNKLKEMNINLERMVQERTIDLSQAHEKLRLSYDQLLLSENGRKKQLAYITHDLRMPLSSMLGYVEAVQDMVKPENNDQYLKYIRDNTIRINQMIEELTFLSHLETGQVSYDMRKTSIESFIQQFYTQYELVVHDADLNFKLNMVVISEQHAPLIVLIDEKKLERALFNILSNAIKFTPKNGTVTISVEVEALGDDKLVSIRVEDSGVGIPPEMLEQIFNRNYKIDRPGLKVEGSGLGLAICREIIQAHKGTVSVESDGRNGSIFYILLPCIA